jgi:hypothetical protein
MQMLKVIYINSKQNNINVGIDTPIFNILFRININ